MYSDEKCLRASVAQNENPHPIGAFTDPVNANYEKKNYRNHPKKCHFLAVLLFKNIYIILERPPPPMTNRWP
jgi:hypothetical protein